MFDKILLRLCLITFHSWKKICRELPTFGAGNFCTRPASNFFWFTIHTKPTRWNLERTPRHRFLEGELICWAIWLKRVCDSYTHKSEIMKHSLCVLPFRGSNPDLCGKSLCCHPLGHGYAVALVVPQQPITNIKCLKCHPADFLISWSNAIHFLSLISISIP